MWNYIGFPIDSLYCRRRFIKLLNLPKDMFSTRTNKVPYNGLWVWGDLITTLSCRGRPLSRPFQIDEFNRSVHRVREHAGMRVYSDEKSSGRPTSALVVPPQTPE